MSWRTIGKRKLNERSERGHGISAARDATIDSAANGEPTPQTVRRRKPDWLDLMRRAGTIDDDQFEAAVAIRRGFEVLTSGVAVAQWDYQRMPGQNSGGEWEPEYRQRLEERFNLWADAMTAAMLPVGVILDIVVDGLSCRETDAKWRRRKGTARDLLRQGLSLFRKVRIAHASGARRGCESNDLRSTMNGPANHQVTASEQKRTLDQNGTKPRESINDVISY